MDEAFSDDAGGYQVEDDEEYVSWVTWFCELKGNEFFCMIDREFIAEDFNLTGLSSMVSFYHYALELILDVESFDSDRLTQEQKRLVESSAETLYGLIHARFITTSRGLKLMEEKFMQGEFGGCPRVFCGGQSVLPVGQSDVVRESSVKLYCPKCGDIFYPRSSRHKTLDGAFWGTSFPHLLLMQMRESGKQVAKPTQEYVPRIYGFRIRQSDASPTVQELIAIGNGDKDAGTGAGSGAKTSEPNDAAAVQAVASEAAGETESPQQSTTAVASPSGHDADSSAPNPPQKSATQTTVGSNSENPAQAPKEDSHP